ncbi:hypothetical protein CsSME_00040506 [Camellia sinensis var. sinensis]
MSERVFFNSRGEGKSLAKLDVEMDQEGHSDAIHKGTGRVVEDRNRRRSPRQHSRSPRRDEPSRSPRSEMQRRKSARTTGGQVSARNESSRPPRPLSFSMLIGNKPMIEADLIVDDPNVAIKFTRKMFLPEVHQSNGQLR